MKLINQHPHRRYNPLIGEWILISPHRTQRPWQGQVEKSSTDIQPSYDPQCYLCPNNVRAGGHKNPDYLHTFVFTNDFAALVPHEEALSSPIIEDMNLLKVQSISGTCRVICFSPRHDLTMASMSLEDIRRVINLWSDQIDELEKIYTWVQVFENKGSAMGCSNPHPHGQIWASNALPNEPFKEDHCQHQYFDKHKRPLLLDYVELEVKKQERVVAENEDWLVVVPFWAVWPFETLLLPKFLVARLPLLTNQQRNSLAAILKTLLQKYDRLFDTSFPYSMGWHAKPANHESGEHWQLHAHFYPPLLRSATIKKFMVGYEMLAEPQRDITAENAAKWLRET